MRARVVSGPFKDLKGQLRPSPRPGRAALRIRAMGRETTLELDSRLLERLEEEPRPRSDRRLLFAPDRHA